jgi:hypothetical protein
MGFVSPLRFLVLVVAVSAIVAVGVALFSYAGRPGEYSLRAATTEETAGGPLPPECTAFEWKADGRSPVVLRCLGMAALQLSDIETGLVPGVIALVLLIAAGPARGMVFMGHPVLRRYRPFLTVAAVALVVGLSVAGWRWWTESAYRSFTGYDDGVRPVFVIDHQPANLGDLTYALTVAGGAYVVLVVGILSARALRVGEGTERDG